MRASRKSGATLEVRLSLLITALLAIVTLAGGTYVVRKARDDIREETQSTLVLTDHFLDAEIDAVFSKTSRSSPGRRRCSTKA